MRLFVAITLPPALRETLAIVQTRVPFLTLAHPENIHLTLKFLGEVHEEKVHKVVAALREIPFSSFPVSTTKFGTFPHAFWLGVKLTKSLAQLQRAVVRAVRPFTTYDPRAFKPHLTIGRMGTLSSEERATLKEICKERLEHRWKVASFELMRSTLTGGGPVHERIASFQ